MRTKWIQPSVGFIPAPRYYIRPEEWDEQKTTIAELFESGTTLKEIRKIMLEEHGFDASIASYKSRFKAWGLRSYTKRKEPDATTHRRPSVENVGKRCHALKGGDWTRYSLVISASPLMTATDVRKSRKAALRSPRKTKISKKNTTTLEPPAAERVETVEQVVHSPVGFILDEQDFGTIEDFISTHANEEEPVVEIPRQWDSEYSSDISYTPEAERAQLSDREVNEVFLKLLRKLDARIERGGGTDHSADPSGIFEEGSVSAMVLRPNLDELGELAPMTPGSVENFMSSSDVTSVLHRVSATIQRLNSPNTSAHSSSMISIELLRALRSGNLFLIDSDDSGSDILISSAVLASTGAKPALVLTDFEYQNLLAAHREIRSVEGVQDRSAQVSRLENALKAYHRYLGHEVDATLNLEYQIEKLLFKINTLPEETPPSAPDAKCAAEVTAWAYADSNLYEDEFIKALPLCESNFRQSGEIYGPDHEMTRYCRFHLAALYVKLRRCDEALSLLLELYDFEQANLPHDDIISMRTKSLTADCLQRLGRVQEARNLSSTIYDMFLDGINFCGRSTSVAYMHLFAAHIWTMGNVRRTGKDLEGALFCYERAFSIFGSLQLPPGHPRPNRVLDLLVETVNARGPVFYLQPIVRYFVGKSSQLGPLSLQVVGWIMRDGWSGFDWDAHPV